VVPLKSFNQLLEIEVARLRSELNTVAASVSGSMMESGAGGKAKKRSREICVPEESAEDTAGKDVENEAKRSRREI
jgi:hypothetical protein